jgi:hypothetical protein
MNCRETYICTGVYIEQHASGRKASVREVYSASELTAPPSLSGNLRSIQERNEGTSSAILFGKEELVMNRGILPGRQIPLRLRQGELTTGITTRRHSPIYFSPVHSF